jgi:5-methylcytosine-specific restriction endonuclease McrA
MTSTEAKAQKNREIALSGLSQREWYRQVYLHSDHWSALRSQRLFVAGFKCEKCPKVGMLDVHHLQYRNIFDVGVEDLQALCRACHNKEHERQKDIRKTSKRKKAAKVTAKRTKKSKQIGTPRPPRPPREKRGNVKPHSSERLKVLMKRYHKVKESTKGSREEKLVAAINSVIGDFHTLVNPDPYETGWTKTILALQKRTISRLKKIAKLKSEITHTPPP